MTRHLFLAAGFIAIAAGNASAQKTQYGIEGGPQYTTAHYDIRGKDQSVSGKFGGHVGLALRIPFEGRLWFAPSLSYSLKGFSVALSDSSSNPGVDAVGNEMRLHVVEIAPLFHVDLGAGKSHPFVQFGAVGEVGLAGTEKLKLKDGTTVNRSVVFGPSTYGRVNFSLALRLGYESASGLYFAAQYLHGLGSLNNNDFGPTIKHRIFGITIGKVLTRR